MMMSTYTQAKWLFLFYFVDFTSGAISLVSGLWDAIHFTKVTVCDFTDDDESLVDVYYHLLITFIDTIGVNNKQKKCDSKIH